MARRFQRCGRWQMAKCPICGKPTEPEFRPFCSARCKKVDLNRWLSDVYRVPADATPPDEDGKSSD
ncbi:DNA gyrase inhibitor YacG [Dongia sp.]|uniref:DNA gyrase inhibitor YacG n=1 Tax=Dongia sp. TaxID=1977262 RepID=UPI0035AFC174